LGYFIWVEMATPTHPLIETMAVSKNWDTAYKTGAEADSRPPYFAAPPT
jgi:hypothetical protein